MKILVLTIATVVFSWSKVAAALRVVSLAPSVTEIVFAVGAGSSLVGVTTHCNHPPQAVKIDRIGPFVAPDLEVMIAKRPDLVIGIPTSANTGTLEALRRAGLKLLIVNPRSIEDIKFAIEQIATAVGQREAGDALIRRIEQEVVTTRRRLDGAPHRRVLLLVGQTPLVAAGGGGFQDELIRLAHGINVAARATGLFPRLSLEFVLMQAPEVILDISHTHPEANNMDLGGFWDVFDSLPAVRFDRVRRIRGDILVRPGPRVGQAFEMLARAIHPERFTPANRVMGTPVDGRRSRQQPIRRNGRHE